MKQKRKVKSLLPEKTDGGNSLLTTLLLVFWMVLCLSSASLMTSSVWAAGWTQPNKTLEYTWLDDKTEVLYRKKFVDPNDLSKVVAEMYADTNGVLHIIPVPLVVNKWDWNSIQTDNSVASNVYGNVLWWLNNDVKSDNVTLIAWNNNDVVSWNTNATVLWWNWNVYNSGNAWWAPMVVIWWSSNVMWSNHNGNVLIWWNSAIIWNNISNSVVLWWEGNEISANNVIVWWKNVKVNPWKSNVFAFSDGFEWDFSPDSSNAFYLNLNRWVWINTSSNKKWLSVNGAISFWEIDINTRQCNEENYWVEWTWNGCLVWCTQAWKSAGKWELLDRWEHCESICNWKCFYTPKNDVPRPADYNSFCSKISIDKAHMCKNVNLYHKDVVFETVLIDSDAACPVASDDNKCFFKCNSWTHLIGNECIDDCVLPWSSTGAKIKHGDQITWYNAYNVYCSSDASSTSNIPDTCEKHKETLKCKNGTLYVKNTTNPAVTANGGYTYQSCMLNQYRCDTTSGGYNLDQNFITNTVRDTVSWNDADRWQSSWTRWVYKLCKDYDAAPSNPQVNGVSCTPKSYHYKLVKCQNWYSTWANHPFECRKKCTLDGWTYVDWQSILWYKSSSVTCPWICESTTLTCNNGTWQWDSTTYSKKSCSLNWVTCSSYTIPSSVVLVNSANSVYDTGCQIYAVNNNVNCVRQDIKYNLIWCANGYHTENGKYCIPNTKQVACTKSGAPANNATYNSYNVTITWNGTWNNGSWPTAENCSWYCNDNYHLENNLCVKNTKTVACTQSWKPNNSSYIPWDVPVTWIGTWDNWRWSTPANCSWSCDAGYCGSSCWSQYSTCSQTGAPSNAHYVNTSEQKCGWWGCDWECDSGYSKSWSSCVQDCPTWWADGLPYWSECCPSVDGCHHTSETYRWSDWEDHVIPSGCMSSSSSSLWGICWECFTLSDCPSEANKVQCWSNYECLSQ